MSKRQYLALMFIRDFIEKNGWSPSYDEICAGLHLKSKSGVNAVVNQLCERGLISVIPNRMRSIKLLQTGEGE